TGGRIRVSAPRALRARVFIVGVHTPDFLCLTSPQSDWQLAIEEPAAGDYEVVGMVNKWSLFPGTYALRLWIGEGIGSSGLFYGENLVHFQVKSSAKEPAWGNDRPGFFLLDATWSAPRVLARDETS